MAKVQVSGSFGSYVLEGKDNYPEDEDAIQAALETAVGMCGNAGQEVMVMDISQDFWDWAIDILETEGSEGADGTSWDSFKVLLLEWYGGRTDKVNGTEEIWGQAWAQVAQQSGYHDSTDEYGEGTGTEF